ncbi:MAG: hypothetical protein L6U99_01420 [Clostridium sp.]|nr:MAG: hypothetical protein L6U99_01420 [Clostridium sp.]
MLQAKDIYFFQSTKKILLEAIIIPVINIESGVFIAPIREIGVLIILGIGI